MKPSRVIESTFFVMLIVQTVGSIDTKHRLPAPRQFVAVSVLWGILFLMADTAMSKLAARLSVLVVLTGMVIGPFGKVAIGFLNKVAQDFQPAQTLRNRFIPEPDTVDTGDTGTTIA